MSHVVREAPHQHVNRGAPFLHKHGSSNGGGLQMFHARSELAVLCLIRGESREGQEELKKRKVTKLHSPVRVFMACCQIRRDLRLSTGCVVNVEPCLPKLEIANLTRKKTNWITVIAPHLNSNYRKD